LASYNFLPTISSTNQTQTTAPSWQPQVGALTTAFGGATQAYNDQLARGPYTGDYVAAPNQTQYDAYGQAANFGSANGGVGQQQINTGQGLLKNYNTAGNAAGALYNFGNQDQTQSNIATANAYAQNPYISGAVEAATRDARSAANKASTNLYRNAAGTNNLNSDRAALIQGEIDSNLAENAQNISASMRNNAFTTGLGTALTENSQGLGALSNAGSMATNLGQAGSGMLSQGINDQTNLSNLYSTAGSGLNALQQSILNNNLAKYQGANADAWSPVQNLYNIAGASNWGSTQNTSGTSIGISPVQNQQRPGALSYLGAGLGMAGSIAGLGMGGGSTLGGMAAGALFPSFMPQQPFQNVVGGLGPNPVRTV
jgi:hypothetical protein